MAGALIWFELPVADTGRARRFYGALFGWRTTAFQGDDYHVIDTDPPGAILAKDARASAPRVYFQADDIAAAVARVRALGGSSEGPVEIPGVGHFAHCRDDQGGAFSLYQPAPRG